MSSVADAPVNPFRFGPPFPPPPHVLITLSQALPGPSVSADGRVDALSLKQKKLFALPISFVYTLKTVTDWIHSDLIFFNL